MRKKFRIAILPGDGIGPEVMRETYKILNLLKKKKIIKIKTKTYDVGGIAIDKYGTALPKKTIEGCKKSDAILFGSVGGEKWNNLKEEEKPERAALLRLRKKFNLFANIRPVELIHGLKDLSPLKIQKKKNINIICVRELTGGIYFCKKNRIIKKSKESYAFDTELYYDFEIKRIAKIAFNLALKRKKKITLIDKSNVLKSSLLWREIVKKVAKNFPEVKLNYMYIDNSVMQIIKNPYQFDVVLTNNLFGDIISDLCGAITGSIGLSPSASINDKKFGLYEPAGGSAPDIAGKNIANPIAQILSLAMLIENSMNLPKIANLIKNSIKKVLEDGFRTKDLTKNKKYISTKKMGKLIRNELKKKIKNEKKNTVR